jgi:HEAT repeat protein
VTASRHAERHHEKAREAVARGDVDDAAGSAWRAAAAAAQAGDEEMLVTLVSFVATLEQESADHRREDVERLGVYVSACLEDARSDTRAPNTMERLLRRRRSD